MPEPSIMPLNSKAEAASLAAAAARPVTDDAGAAERRRKRAEYQKARRAQKAAGREPAAATAAGDPAAADAPPRLTAEQLADLTNRTVWSVGMALGGPGMDPKPEEREAMNGALASYYASRPDISPPPWLLLIAAYTPYVARLPQQETFSGRMRVIIGRFSAWGGGIVRKVLPA